MKNISEQKKIKKLEEFSEFNKKLSDCVRYLGGNLEVLTYLRNWGAEKDKTARKNELFFIITDDAIYNNIIVTFDNLLYPKSHGIQKYLEKTEQDMKFLVTNESDRKIFCKEVISQKNAIKSHSANNNLRKRRNQKTGHFDPDYLFHNEKVDKDMPLSNEEVSSLIELFQEILDWHRENILNNSFPFSWGKAVSEDSIKSLLSDLILVECLKEKHPEIYLELKTLP